MRHMGNGLHEHSCPGLCQHLGGLPGCTARASSFLLQEWPCGGCGRNTARRLTEVVGTHCHHHTLGLLFLRPLAVGVTDHVQERLFPFLYTCVSTGKLLSLRLCRTTLSDGLARGHHPILLNGWDPKKLVDFTGLLIDLALSKWAP